jgi:S-formylglutathione hydrolase FrmB
MLAHGRRGRWIGGAWLLLLVGCSGAAPPAHHVPAPLGPSGGRFRVLAPPPPSAGAGPFPVVYFLHDSWGSDAVLWKQGVAQRLVRAQEEREVAPFLLVAPEGDRAFWADSWDGARRWEQWVREELPAQVASRWPVREGPGSRAYAGISMGGLGAVKMGLRQRRETAAVVSISGVLVPIDGGFVRAANPFVRRALRRAFGAGPDAEALRRNDPYRLLAEVAAPGGGLSAGGPEPRTPRLLFLAGSEDKYRLDEASRLFHEQARAKGLESELRIVSGGHDWRYWREAAVEGILWAARNIEGAGRPDGERGAP